MERISLKRFSFAVFLVLILMSGSLPAMAAKPVVSSAVNITTSDFSKTLSGGESFEFEVVAKYGATKVLTWTSSENLVLISGPKRIGGQEKAVYRYTAPILTETTTDPAWVQVADASSEDRLNISFTVTATETTNHPPVAEPLLLSTDEDAQVTGIIIASDPDGDPLTGSIATQPSNGIASINGLSVTYTPNPNFSGSDPFLVRIEDGSGGSVVVTVTGEVAPVDDPPTAIDDSATTNQDTPVSIPVLNNDQDIDGGDLFITSVNSGTHGTTALQPDQTVLYTPDTGYYGTDSFQYTLNEGAFATVMVIILEGSAEPIRYVALGDSIPYGYYYTSFWNYLTGGTDSDSYVEQFARYLDVDSGNFTDASVSGHNAVDVYNQIDGLTAVIQQADVITLCVGANDVMDAVERNLSGLDKYSITWATADSGRDNFEYYWPRVIDKIENLNPDVTLIVMTIYNPYHSYDSFYAQVDPYFTDTSLDNLGLNTIIENTMTFDNDGTFWTSGQLNDAFDYHVVDIYETFNNYENKDSLTGFYSSFCDPHPTQLGQNVIFNAHQSVYATIQ